MSFKLPLIGFFLVLAGTSPIAYSLLSGNSKSSEKQLTQKEKSLPKEDECNKDLTEETFCFCSEFF